MSCTLLQINGFVAHPFYLSFDMHLTQLGFELNLEFGFLLRH